MVPCGTPGLSVTSVNHPCSMFHVLFTAITFYAADVYVDDNDDDGVQLDNFNNTDAKPSCIC